MLSAVERTSQRCSPAERNVGSKCLVVHQQSTKIETCSLRAMVAHFVASTRMRLSEIRRRWDIESSSTRRSSGARGLVELRRKGPWPARRSELRRPSCKSYLVLSSTIAQLYGFKRLCRAAQSSGLWYVWCCEVTERKLLSCRVHMQLSSASVGFGWSRHTKLRLHLSLCHQLSSTRIHI